MTKSVARMRARSDTSRPLLLGLLIIAAFVLVACGNARREPVTFEGQFYRAKLSRVDKQRQKFTIAVSPVSASFEGALEAGRFEATRHCIENFGTSDVDWLQGPESDPESLEIVNDTLNLSGSCRF